MKFSTLAGLAVILAGGCAAPTPSGVPSAVGALVMREQPESAGASFLGSAVCGACHAAARQRWLATGHAREFAGLLPVDRPNSACLRCHVTGYGERSGYRATGEGLDLSNVGCEACHGPGADHGRSAHPELVPTRTGGECPPCEVNRICRLCHTPERSPGFDLARDLARVTCKP